jgi:hypothetical protein
MGFAAGVKAGTGLVDSILSERRANEEFGWKRADRTREEGIRARDDALRDKNLALYDDDGTATTSAQAAQPRAGLEVPSDQAIAAPVPGAAAAPAVAKAQGDAGVRVGTAQGIPTNAPGSPMPDVPVSAGQANQAIAGTATAPTPTVQATPAAGGEGGPQLGRDQILSRDQQIARNQQQQALLRNNTQAYAQAKQAEDAANIRAIDNKVGKMTRDQRLKYAEENINTEGGMPMIISEKGKGGYTVTSYGPDGKAKETLINDAQLSELVASHMMSGEGYATEGFKRAGAVHKDLADLIGKYNTGTTTMQQSNNTATRYANQDEKERMQLAEQSRHNQASEANQAAHVGIARGKAERERWVPSGPTNDDRGIILIDQNTGETKIQPLPEGTSAKALWPKITGVRGGAGGGSDEFKPVQAEGTVVRNKRGDTAVVGSQGEMVAHGAPTNALGREKFLTKIGIPKAATKNYTFEPTPPGSTAIPVSYTSPATGEKRVYDLANEADQAEIMQAYKWDTEGAPGIQEGFAKLNTRMQNSRDSAAANANAAANSRGVLANIRENERMRAQRLAQ